MQKRILWVLGLIIYVFFIHIGHAQILPFRNYSTEDGLPQSQVSSIIQDHYGYLWIGTLGGVCRYDGQTFHEYPIQNRDVRTVFEDHSGKIWVGTKGGGLFCITNKAHFSDKNFVGLNYIIDMTQIVKITIGWPRMVVAYAK